MRAVDWDLIRGGHYGQRSCEPHPKAEHMAAPTNPAQREESSCQLGAVHTWPFTTARDLPHHVGCRRQSGPAVDIAEVKRLTRNGHDNEICYVTFGKSYVSTRR